MLSSREMRKLLGSVGMTGMSRSVGCPEQVYVNSMSKVYEYYSLWFGELNSYISVNSFPELFLHVDDYGRRRWKPARVRVERVIIDLETTDRNEFIYQCSRLRNLDVGFKLIATGGRGIHFHIPLEEEEWRYEERVDLSNNLRSLVEYLCWRGKGTRSMVDMMVGSNPRAICRMPGAMAVMEDGTRRHTVVFEERDYGRLPELYRTGENRVTPWEPKETLREIVRRLGIKVTSRPAGVEGGRISLRNPGRARDSTRYLDLISRRYPCVAENMRTHNPSHVARRHFAITMYMIGKTAEDIDKIYQDLSEIYGYVDRANVDKRRKNIYSLSTMEKPDSCSSLKKAGLCLGKRCWRYRGG